MTPADLDRAVELAREAAGVAASVPGRAVTVRRLDRDAEYALVFLGEEGSSGWIAAVNVVDRDVMTWAANPSGESTLPPGDGEYVWKPSRESRSPLFPLLQ